jgi:hypothetical protein
MDCSRNIGRPVFIIIRTSSSIDSSKPQINANCIEEFQFPHHRKLFILLVVQNEKVYSAEKNLEIFSIKLGGRSSSIQIKRAKI